MHLIPWAWFVYCNFVLVVTILMYVLLMSLVSAIILLIRMSALGAAEGKLWGNLGETMADYKQFILMYELNT